MAEAEKAVIDRLLADATVDSVMGDRVYFTDSPQPVTMPFAVLTRIDAPRVHSMTGPSGLAAARIQVDCYAKTASTARAAAAAIRVSLDGFRGLQSGINVQGVLLLDEMDGYSEDSESRRVTQDYRVWYRE